MDPIDRGEGGDARLCAGCRGAAPGRPRRPPRSPGFDQWGDLTRGWRGQLSGGGRGDDGAGLAEWSVYDRWVLIYAISVSVDGYIADRDGGIDWHVPSDELFEFHLARVRGLGAYVCGRKLYETMVPWEGDPSLRETELGAEFADVWCAVPKVVFSRTLERVEGNARLARGSVAEEIAAALAETARDVEIGGAGLAGAAMELGLVDELHIFRVPIVLGGGTPHLPVIAHAAPLDLIDTRTFAGGVVFERYRRVRAAAD